MCRESRRFVALPLLFFASGQAAAAPQQTSQTSVEPVQFEVASGDGLRLGLGIRGAIESLDCGAQEIALRGERGGIFVTDVQALLTPFPDELNEAPNPSFEMDSDADAFPDAWEFVDFWGSGGSACWDATEANDGSYSIRLDGAGGEAIWSDVVRVAGGKRFIAQAHRKGDGSLRVLAFWYDAAGLACGALLGPWHPPSSVFEPFGDIVVAPPGAVYVRFGLQTSNGPSTYLDSARWVGPDTAVHSPLEGEVRRGPGAILQETVNEAIGLSCSLRLRGVAQGVVGTLLLDDLRGEERALDVEVVLPVRTEGYRYHGDARHTIDMVPLNLWGEFQRYENCWTGIPVGRGCFSLYPLAAVTAPWGEAGVVLGVPPMAEGPFTIGFDTAPGGGFILSQPLALSRHVGARPGRLEFFVARVDGSWGLRGGLEKQAALYPEYGERRFGEGGLWLPFTSPATIRDVGDFRFAVHEGDNSVALDDALGILSFVYIEPWDFWVDLGDFTERPAYEDGLQRLADLAGGGGGWPESWRDLARATFVGGHQDASGRFCHLILNAPWISGSGWSLLVSHNPEAVVADGSVRDWPSPYRVQLGFVEAAYERASESGAVLDGTYLDSMSTYFGFALDRRERQWQGIETSLTYDAVTHVPALWPPSQVVAVARSHAEREWPTGRFVMGNAIQGASRPAACYLDYMGVEANWGAGVEGDAILLLRRVAAYHKPYCILQNTDFTAFGREQMERYMTRCLAYGIYASCFSADASSDPYWEDPGLYERDRDLFVKYVPLVQELDRGGWEPVTHARSDQPSVVVERFGSASRRLFFTTLNDSPDSSAYTLTIDKAPLGLTWVSAVIDRLTGSSLPFTQDAEEVWVADWLGAGETRLLEVK
ncbi:MAG: hypothetical protein AB1486_09505 [Planctomycetota bacterium]